MTEQFKGADELNIRTLAQERKLASFSPREMEHFLNGGQDRTALKEKMMAILESDPIYSKADKHFLSRPDTIKRVLQKVVHALGQSLELGLNLEESSLLILGLDEELPVGLHFGMFIPTLAGQGDREQQQKWLPLAKTFGIIGCYAQTELGHGSNVRGLETTATYDKKTQEFVMHSPTLTSTKWWPGGLGLTSNHCVTHARLIIDGKDYGVNTFIVQLRSLEDHKPLPGVTIGDIGPKFGYESQDNGFLRFDNVRIPRDQMLSKYKKVSPEGVYSEPPKEFGKLGYATMILLRAQIVQGGSSTLGKAVTIAVRYSAVRRQFAAADSEEGGESKRGGGGSPGSAGGVDSEQQVLNYQMQQYRLLPLVAAAYALHFTGLFMKTLYSDLMKGLEHADASALPEVHATSAGLKALTTSLVSDGIEECRKCCGGHGYSKAAALSSIFEEYVPSCTYEGDNTILALQTARYLLKAAALATSKGGAAKLVGATRYLAAKEYAQPCPAKSSAEMRLPSNVLHAFAHRARGLVFDTAKRLKDLTASGKMNSTQAWNHVMVDLVRMAKAHCQYTVILNFVNAIADLRKAKPTTETKAAAKGKDGKEGKEGKAKKAAGGGENEFVETRPVRTPGAAGVAVLERLCSLLSLYWVEQDIGAWLMSGYVSPAQARWAGEQVRLLLAELRPDAVALVDSFGFSDYTLNSSLGRKNGDVYSSLWAFAQTNPLNHQPTGPGYEEYIRPLLSGQVLQDAIERRAAAAEAKQARKAQRSKL